MATQLAPFVDASRYDTIESAIQAAWSSGLSLYLGGGKTYPLSGNFVINQSLKVFGDRISSITGDDGAGGFYRLDCQSDLYLEDVLFDTFWGIDLTNVPGIQSFQMVRCSFTNGFVGAMMGDIVASLPSPDINKGFSTFKVLGCYFNNLTGPAVSNKAGRIQGCEVSNNVMRTIQRRGIQIGANYDVNVTNYQNYWNDYVVANNQIDDVKYAGSGCNGITLYGVRVKCYGNAVSNVSRTDASNVDVDGIYTKLIDSDVFANSLLNCGMGEGSINLKGQNKNAIQDLLFTTAGVNNWVAGDTFLLTLGATSTGNIAYSNDYTTFRNNIQTACDAAFSAGNTLVHVVDVQGTGLSAKPVEVFIEMTGTYAGTFPGDMVPTVVSSPTGGTLSITVNKQPKGYDVRCFGNNIDGATDHSNGIKSACERQYIYDNTIKGCINGVYTQSVALNRDVHIHHNYIKDLSNPSSACYMFLVAGNPINVRIEDNICEGAVSGSGNSCYGLKVLCAGEFLEFSRNRIRAIGATGGSTDFGAYYNDQAAAPIGRIVMRGNEVEGVDTALRTNGVNGSIQCADKMWLTDNQMDRGVTTPATWTAKPTQLWLRGNTGVVSESSGIATIVAGNLFITVTHGITLPSGLFDAAKISFVPSGVPGNVRIGVNNIGATTFDIRLSGVLAANQSFGWQCEVNGPI